MNLEHIYKKSLTHQILRNDISYSMLHHAYMIVSTDKIKINEYAKLMACEVFCANNNKPCLECFECKKVLHGTHSDIAVYPDKERLTVEESRKIASDIFIAPFESKHKVYIIENFDNATLQSQNALLKTLEEPTSFVIFILLVNNENNVATTIKSRVKTITERLIEKEDLINIFSVKTNFKSEELQTLCVASNGNLTVAKEYLENANISKILSLVSDVFFEMKKSSDVLHHVERALKFKGDDMPTFLDQMLILINNYAIFLTNKDNIKDSDLTKYFIQNASDYSPKVLEKISKHINTAYKKLESHCGQTAIFDSLFMSILEEKFLYKNKNY